MDRDTFNELLEMVRPMITKKNTVMRQAVSAEERLIATLRFLATGRSYKDLRFSTVTSFQLLSKIIPETCWAIYKALKKTIKVVYYNDIYLSFSKITNSLIALASPSYIILFVCDGMLGCDGDVWVGCGDGDGFVGCGDDDGWVGCGDGVGLVGCGYGDGLVGCGDGVGLEGCGDGWLECGDGDGWVGYGDGDGWM
ncbi:unnamed protein product [Parnassius apollo]|uniref:(apollo) hypothetical protein n=1 Tax=Parnassius apollo TaxID=110799 RepID=A0A8S3XVY0_PARAO|nr:unnamed protein product [Parnassius apollo]